MDARRDLSKKPMSWVQNTFVVIAGRKQKKPAADADVYK